MPFKSKAQARACFARKDPKWDCGHWASVTDFKSLPERKKKKRGFKEWLSEVEQQKNEVSTSTSCVATFARPTLPMVTRMWPGPWGEEDPFFRKKKKKS